MAWCISFLSSIPTKPASCQWKELCRWFNFNKSNSSSTNFCHNWYLAIIGGFEYPSDYMYECRNDSKVSDTGLGKQCRHRSDCCGRSSLIKVYTVCKSVCIIWTNYSMVKPPCSSFRVVKVNFSGFRFFFLFLRQLVSPVISLTCA